MWANEVAARFQLAFGGEKPMASRMHTPLLRVDQAIGLVRLWCIQLLKPRSEPMEYYFFSDLFHRQCHAEVASR